MQLTIGSAAIGIFVIVTLVAVIGLYGTPTVHLVKSTVPADCQEVCYSEALTVSPPDHSRYILSYLNKNGVCKASATITRYRFSGIDGCSCYETRLPSISIGVETLFCRNTDCGDVPCNGERSCNCGPHCVTRVSCAWGGWQVKDGEYVGTALAENES